jgi:uncharacterized protein RhaS with RHS repeats
MKTKRLIAVLLGLASLALFAADASAYYHPTVGRWIQRDPIGYGGGANVYGYAGGQPMGRTDASGLYGKDVHYYATLKSAKEAGYDEDSATKIGAGDQWWDEGGRGAPLQGILSLLGIGLLFGTDKTYDVHFPGAGPPSLFVPQKQVVEGSSNNESVKRYIREAKESCTAEAIGKAFHSLQDSYAHAGQPDGGGHPKRDFYSPFPKDAPKEPGGGLFDQKKSVRYEGGDGYDVPAAPEDKGSPLTDNGGNPIPGKEQFTNDQAEWDRGRYERCKVDVDAIMKEIHDKCPCVKTQGK